MRYTYYEMEELLLKKYNITKNIWMMISVEMMRETNNCTKKGTVKFMLDGKPCCITWEDYYWYIEKED